TAAGLETLACRRAGCGTRFVAVAVEPVEYFSRVAAGRCDLPFVRMEGGGTGAAGGSADVSRSRCAGAVFHPGTDRDCTAARAGAAEAARLWRASRLLVRTRFGVGVAGICRGADAHGDLSAAWHRPRNVPGAVGRRHDGCRRDIRREDGSRDDDGQTGDADR